MTVPTQALITRCVKAAIKGAHAMGLSVAGYKVTFSQGVPSVEVTTGPESPPAPPVQTGGVNVTELKEALRTRHATRRP